MRTAVLEQVGAAGWAAVVTVVGALIGWLSTRKKNQADVASVLSETSIEWIRELRSEADRLRLHVDLFEDEVAECERRYDRLEARYEALVAYLREMGLDPPADTE
jgi:LPS sulfotransferase NodH